MDINEFVDLLQEYTLDDENYKQWREIHGKAFGNIFTSSFEESSEAQIHLTAALIKISKRDFEGGLAILLMLENVCYNDFDCFALYYFIGLCYEFLENEELMNKYYQKMLGYDENYLFKIAFHPYYRMAKFAQRKAECKKALKYYNKATELYSKNETNIGMLENLSQIYFDMGTVYSFSHNYDKAWEFLEKSYKCNPIENPQRNYVKAILYAIDGKSEDVKLLIDSMPDYLKLNCKQLTSALLNRQELHYFAIEQDRKDYGVFWNKIAESENILLQYIKDGENFKAEEIISQYLTETIQFMKKQLICSIEKKSSMILVKCRSGYTKTLTAEYEALFSMKYDNFSNWEFIAVNEF